MVDGMSAKDAQHRWRGSCTMPSQYRLGRQLEWRRECSVGLGQPGGVLTRALRRLEGAETEQVAEL